LGGGENEGIICCENPVTFHDFNSEVLVYLGITASSTCFTPYIWQPLVLPAKFHQKEKPNQKLKMKQILRIPIARSEKNKNSQNYKIWLSGSIQKGKRMNKEL
jgi:hypothetical protein